MRGAFFTTAILLCLATASMADNRKKDNETRPNKTRHEQMARSDDGRSASYLNSAKNCPPPAEESKPQIDNSQGVPVAPQNQVEYRGGG